MKISIALSVVLFAISMAVIVHSVKRIDLLEVEHSRINKRITETQKSVSDNRKILEAAMESRPLKKRLKDWMKRI